MILFENFFKPRQLPSATSKQCFEQPAASFLVCFLIFIEYEFNGCQFSLGKGRVGRGVVLPSLHT